MTLDPKERTPSSFLPETSDAKASCPASAAGSGAGALGSGVFAARSFALSSLGAFAAGFASLLLALFASAR